MNRSLRKLNGQHVADMVLGMLIVLMLATQIMQHWWIPPGDRFNLIHIVLAAAIVSLRLGQEGHRFSQWVLAFFGLALLSIAFAYFWGPAVSLENQGAVATRMDFVLGSLLLGWIVFLVYRSFGLVFASLGFIAVAYAFLGAHVPEPFTGPPVSFNYAMARLTLVSPFTGVIDSVTRFVWFVIFWGMLVETSGAGRVIHHMSRILGSKLKSGPALMAVIGSAIVGSLNSAGGSNVAITGPVTIPMMKRAGYTSGEAGAIEAAASTGSGITPPIMGVVPFIMADQLGVPYWTVVKMVLLVAFFWYFSVAVYVVAAGFCHPHLKRVSITELHAEPMSFWEFVKSAALLVLPVGGLVLFIVQGFTLPKAILYAFLILVLLALTLRVERRLDVWWSGIGRAASMASSVIMAIVIVNVLVDVMNFTGIGFRLGDIVFSFSGGSLLYAGFLVLVFGTILGAGLPPLVVYFVMIVTFKPVFFAFDLPDAVTLFTAFYMGVLANISPPTAPAALVAAALSGAGFWEVSLLSMKVAASAFFIPFIVLVAPEILLGAPGIESVSVQRLVFVTSAIVLALGLLSAGLAGWLGVRLKWWGRLILIAIPLVMYAGLYNKMDELLWLSILASIGSLVVASFGSLSTSRAGSLDLSHPKGNHNG